MSLNGSTVQQNRSVVSISIWIGIAISKKDLAYLIQILLFELNILQLHRLGCFYSETICGNMVSLLINQQIEQP